MIYIKLHTLLNVKTTLRATDKQKVHPARAFCLGAVKLTQVATLRGSLVLDTELTDKHGEKTKKNSVPKGF